MPTWQQLPAIVLAVCGVVLVLVSLKRAMREPPTAGELLIAGNLMLIQAAISFRFP